MFYSGHARIASSLALIRSGFEGRAERRYAGYRAEYRALAAALPANARVLLHSSHITLGIDREVLLDWTGFQGLVSYAKLRTPRELYDYYRSLGVTHLLYVPRERPASSRQEEVLWNAFVTRHAVSVPGSFGAYRLLKMPPAPPPVEAPYRVAVFGMPGYADGVYPIEALHTIEYLWPSERKYRPPELAFARGSALRKESLASVDAVLLGHKSARERSLAAELKGNSAAIKYAGQFSLHLLKRAPIAEAPASH
jgi:hypothetical protein